MYRFLLPLLLLLAVACAPRTGAPAADKAAAMSKDTTIPTPSAWRIVAFSVDGKQSPAVNKKGFVALRDGQVGGHSGCNSFGGEFTGDVTKMKVGGVMSTKMYCAEANEQERAVLDLFNGTVRAKMDGQTLILTGGDNELRLERDDALLNN